MEEQFEIWLEGNLNLSENSVKKYCRAIRAITKDMLEEGVIDKNLYNISSSLEFERYMDIIYNNNVFVEKDTRGNRMYSVAMKHYLRFLQRTDKYNYNSSWRLL